MTDTWSNPDIWHGLGSPLETPASPPANTRDVVEGASVEVLRRLSFGGIRTAVSAEQVPEEII